MQRFSEPFPPHGALAAEGAENLLGRPRLDPLVVLVREAVQNSWDARTEDARPVAFGVAGHHLDASQRDYVRREVFRDVPRAAPRLREVLARDELLLLSLTDRGTSGLAGPVRADRPPGRNEPSNFVDLLFNIGQPAERAFGGGTYGFGRTISYVVSEARAILVHSRTRAGRRLQSRFIAAAFSDHYTEGDRRFTGRHWWGNVTENTVEPILGDEADAMARGLGMPVFDRDETGTTITVVAPDLRGRTAPQAFRFMAGALTWNFWPKMIPTDGTPASMTFSVSIDGMSLPVMAPSEVPPLHAFEACLRAVRDADRDADDVAPRPKTSQETELDTHVDEVVLPKTGERIGWLALTRAPVAPRPAIDEGADDEIELGPSAPFTSLAHHVALLRRPELVVEYLDTAELPSVSSEYVGVFKPVKMVDRAFAKAEPPTHDAWNPNLVGETKLRRFVAVALRTIRERTQQFAERPSAAAVDLSAARIADIVRTLFDLDGAEPAAAQPSLPSVTVERIEHLEGGRDHVSEVTFSIEHAPGTAGTVVEATARVASHDGWVLDRSTGNGAVGGDVEVLGFHGEPSTPMQTGRRLVVRRGDQPRWSVRLRAQPALSLGVDLDPRPLEEASS
jgi:hypothetical protein